MHASDPAAEVYYSSWAGDADLAELIALFVAELPERIDALREAVASDEVGEVARLAHQLKGAGGSHGFPQITAAAAEVQRRAYECASHVEILAALERLSAVCTACRGGSAVLPGPGRSSFLNEDPPRVAE